MRGVPVAQIKNRCDLALIGTGTDQFRPPAPAKNEPQRIQQNGFPRARFTGQHVQTGLKAQIEMVDNQQIPDVETAQHRLSPQARENQSHCP